MAKLVAAHAVCLRHQLGVRQAGVHRGQLQRLRPPREAGGHTIHPALGVTHLRPPLVMVIVRAIWASNSVSRSKRATCSCDSSHACSAFNATDAAFELNFPVTVAAAMMDAQRWASSGVSKSPRSCVSR